MSSLTGRSVASSYTELIKTSASTGFSSTLATLEDGDGTSSALQLSTTGIKSTGTLEVVGSATLGSLTVVGAAVINGLLTANGGTITFGDADTDNVVFGADVNSHILPNTDNTYDLGSSIKTWRNLYLGTAIVSNLSITGSQTISATTQSTNKDTGAFVVEGGVGVEKNVNIGGNLGVVGTTTLTGNTSVSGTLGVTGAITVTSTINGTTIPGTKTLVTTVDTQTLTNKTLTTPVISSISNTGTLTLPTSTDTIVGRATTDTLTNKTITLASNTLIATSAQILAAVSDETGTGSLVFSGSPELTGTPTAPTAGANTNTTQVATTAHVFAERANTVTLTNKTLNLTSNTFVATSAQLASSVSDETGSGSLVFATSPTLTTPAISSIVNTGTLTLPTTTSTLLGWTANTTASKIFWDTPAAGFLSVVISGTTYKIPFFT